MFDCSRGHGSETRLGQEICQVPQMPKKVIQDEYSCGSDTKKWRANSNHSLLYEPQKKQRKQPKNAFFNQTG